MEYKYKSYPENNWKLHTSWVHLKQIPKFAYTVTTTTASTSTQNAISGDSENNNNENGTTASTEKNQESLCISNPARGIGRGQKAAIAQKLKTDNETRKRNRDEEKDKKMDLLIENMSELKEVMNKKSKASIVKYALKSCDDADNKKRLQDKLIQMALDI